MAAGVPRGPGADDDDLAHHAIGLLSLPDGRRLQRRPAFLHVDAELHALARRGAERARRGSSSACGRTSRRSARRSARRTASSCGRSPRTRRATRAASSDAARFSPVACASSSAGTAPTIVASSSSSVVVRRGAGGGGARRGRRRGERAGRAAGGGRLGPQRRRRQRGPRSGRQAGTTTAAAVSFEMPAGTGRGTGAATGAAAAGRRHHGRRPARCTRNRRPAPAPSAIGNENALIDGLRGRGPEDRLEVRRLARDPSGLLDRRAPSPG